MAHTLLLLHPSDIILAAQEDLLLRNSSRLLLTSSLLLNLSLSLPFSPPLILHCTMLCLTRALARIHAIRIILYTL
jgi:hypothetical protein